MVNSVPSVKEELLVIDKYEVLVLYKTTIANNSSKNTKVSVTLHVESAGIVLFYKEFQIFYLNKFNKTRVGIKVNSDEDIREFKKPRYEPVYAHIGPNNLIQIGCLIMTQENFKLLYNNIKQTKNELLRKSREVSE